MNAQSLDCTSSSSRAAWLSARRFSGDVSVDVEFLARDPVAAAQAARASCEALQSAGDRAYLATRATQLAEALYLTGELVEAERWSRLAQDSGAADDVPTQFMWRSVTAKLRAKQGNSETALALAREACDF